MKTPLALSIAGFTIAWWVWPFVLIGLFFAYDLWQRYREFRRVRTRLREGTDDLLSLVERKRFTRCQRELLVVAAEQAMGAGHEVRTHYRALGYRWYHFAPDWAWTDPMMFFRPSWWRVFLGLKK